MMGPREQEKRKKEHRLALGLGLGTTGALAASEGLAESGRDALEDAMRRSRSKAEFMAQLQPGDILLGRYADKISPHSELAGVKMPLRDKHTIALGTGSINYHASVYGGRGKVHQALGAEWPFEADPLGDALHGQDVKAYRPGNATAAEREAALKFLREAKGTPYSSTGETIMQGLGNILGISPSSKSACGKGALNCTQSVAGAYPEQFKKLYATPDEIRSAPGMKLVARYGRVEAPGLVDKLLARAIHPTLKNAKYGLLAGLGGLAAAKAYNAYKGDDE